VLATIFWSLAQAEPEPANDVKDLYPHWEELLVGALAFAVLFYFMWKWVLPRISKLLEERRDKIQGDLERAEETRRKLYDMAATEKLLIQGYHYPFPAAGYIEKDGAGYRLVPISWNPVI